MAVSFGVHFGSTNSCISSCKEGNTNVIANDVGDRTTPSVVAFSVHDRVTGLAAKHGIIRNASNTVCNVKDFIGRPWSEIKDDAKRNQVEIFEKSSGEVVYELEYKERRAQFTRYDIANFIYKKMNETANTHGSGDLSYDTVITAPEFYTSAQCKTLSNAAIAGGFNVVDVISESSAALLAYDIGQQDNRSDNTHILVYRLGGTSLELTILLVSGGMYRSIAYYRNEDLGGKIVDDIIIEYFANEFQRKWKVDCRSNRRSMLKLRSQSENCKHILSTMNSAQIAVDSLFEGIDFQSTLARSRFEGLISNYVNKCMLPLKEVLSDAGINYGDISKVVLSGGSTKIPSLKKKLSEIFSNEKILCSLSPDEIISIGAAKQASILSALDQSEIELCESFADDAPALNSVILISTNGENANKECKYEKILDKYTPIPVRRVQSFKLNTNQTSCVLNVYEQNASDNTLLAKIVLKNLPENKDGPLSINCVYHVRTDGTLHVTCTEPISKITSDIVIDVLS